MKRKALMQLRAASTDLTTSGTPTPIKRESVARCVDHADRM